MAKRKAVWGDTLYICGKAWRVELVEHAFGAADDTTAVSGSSTGYKQVIQVSLTSSPDAQRATLVHELDHSVVKSVCNEHPTDEEACTQAHECGWYSMFRDPRNDWVWSVLMEDR